MIKQKKKCSNGDRQLAGIIATTALCTSALTPAIADAEVKIRPRVQLGAIFIDNVELVPDGADKDTEYVLESLPGLNIELDSTRLDATLDYALRDYRYIEDSDRNQSFHEVAADASLILVRDLLDFDAHGGYTQTLVDPLRTVNFQRLFDVGNLVDKSVISGGPRLHRDLRFARLEGSYDYSSVEYKGAQANTEGIEGSDNQAVQLSLASDEDSPSRFGWGLAYNWRDVDYEFSLPYRFQSATANVGYRISRTITLLADGGVESDVTESRTEGKLDSEVWHGGFRYSPDRNMRFEAVAGHRFFGDSYRAELTRRARLLTLSMSYTEEPTTETELGGRGVLADDVDGIGTPLDDLTGLTRPTTEIFVNREFRGTLSLKGSYTEISLSGYRQRREYIELNSTDSVIGGALDFIRRLSPRTSLTAGLTFEDIDARTGEQFYYYTGRAGLEFSLSQTFSLTAEVMHVMESTEQIARANAVSLRLSKTFGRD